MTTTPQISRLRPMRLLVVCWLLAFWFPCMISGLANVRLASWNILAQSYVKHEKYPWVESPEFLEWPYRNNLLTDKLLDMEADLICLQEVQNDLFPDIMSKMSHSYNGVLQNVSETHNVGTAFLLKKDCPLAIRRAESRSRALITVLEDKQDGEALLYVCSVHLDADKSWDQQTRKYHQRQRENQLKSLIKRINHQCKLDNQDINNVPIIIAGDFNILRSNPINEAMSKGTVHPRCDVHLHDVYLQNEREDRSSLPLYEKEGGGTATTFETSHLTKTYRGGAVLDYIYISDQVQIHDTLLCHPKSSTLGGEKWPSKDHPSDHLPVGIDFEWSDKLKP